MGSGCVEPTGGAELGDEDPRAPGELLGFYSLEGKLTEDDCGAESLNAPQTWSFDVKLSRDGSALYWLNGREAIVGSIDEAGSFAFETHLDLRLAERNGSAKGCTIVRRDSAAGALARSEESLTVTLSYSYDATGDSDCSDFAAGTQGMPQTLPCSLAYRLEGARVRAD